jgi:nitrogen fixation NifU-like protein
LRNAGTTTQQVIVAVKRKPSLSRHSNSNTVVSVVITHSRQGGKPAMAQGKSLIKHPVQVSEHATGIEGYDVFHDESRGETEMTEESSRDLPERPPEPGSLPAGPILLYNETVIEHFMHPRNVGELENPDGEAVVGDPMCGDQMKVSIRVDNGIISDIKFKSFGCPGAISTSSMVTELAKGKSTVEALMITDDDVVLALGGIPAHKKHCSLLGVQAVQQAIQDYLRKQKPGVEPIHEKDISGS